MPIHIDPLSRRRFLQGASILSLSPFAPILQAAESETWALLSDTHIAADPLLKSRQDVNMADNLKRVVADVLKEKESLSGVIIDGDCAFLDGQPGDYSTLASLLSPLEEAGLPIHFTLGNHDDRDVFYGAYKSRAGSSPVASKHCTIIETAHADLILLDSLRFVNKVEGEIGEEQLQWIASRLSKNPNRPAILIGHHYPQVVRTDVIPGEKKIPISGLVDSEEFLKTIADHPSAKAYIYGHSHNWTVKKDEADIHQINLPPTAYVFDQSRPNGWVKATIGKNGMTLRLNALDPSHGQNGEMHTLEWRS